MIGSVLGNRYEILKEIGVGGMARVYVAKCRYLNRLVAIKVLKDEFKQDNDFLKRFEVEAQAAGSLMHPNIVQIYDVGREGDLPYIVMEYVDGQTLKDLIQNDGPIPWQRAIDLAIQICSAIQKAHQKEIIHRDIKPQNILLTLDGIPKVADFGIARATSAQTATMKVDAVASVHYSSPEQVRGGYTDHTTDIYSMGVTLYEMLSGKLPFEGETTVSVAMKHIHDELPEKLFEGMDIPEALSVVVVHAMSKLKADRYQDMSELISDLEQIRGVSPKTGLVLPYHKLNAEKQQIARISPMEEEKMPQRKTNKPRAKRNTSRIILPIVYIVLIGILIFLSVTFFNWIKGGLGEVTNTEEEKEFTVADYSGREINEVVSELEIAGVNPEIKYEYHETIPENTIISQTPLEGSVIKIGGITVLELTVSKGPNQVTVPDVRFQNYNDMRFELEGKYGLLVELKNEYHESIETNMVIRTEPEAGATLMKGDTIILYWSLGPEKKQVLVPDLLTLTRSEAEKKLTAKGLIVGKILPAGENVDERTVTAQKPSAGDTVLEGTAVDLTFDPITEETVSPGDPGATTGEMVNKTVLVELEMGKTYDTTVRLLVVVKDNATDVDTIFFDADVATADFPLAVLVSIPTSGGVSAYAFINGEPVLRQDYD